MKLFVFSDGGSRGNPGSAAYGFAVFNQERELIFDGGEYIGKMTNNEAEYLGLIAVLKALLSFQNLGQVETVAIHLDSKLVVEQVLGNWKVKEARLRPFVDEARDLLTQLPIPYQLVHVPRKQNSVADAKVNEILDQNC